ATWVTSHATVFAAICWLACDRHCLLSHLLHCASSSPDYRRHAIVHAARAGFAHERFLECSLLPLARSLGEFYRLDPVRCGCFTYGYLAFRRSSIYVLLCVSRLCDLVELPSVATQYEMRHHQAMEQITSGCYNLLFVSSNSNPAAMCSLARSASSWFR